MSETCFDHSALVPEVCRDLLAETMSTTRVRSNSLVIPNIAASDFGLLIHM